MRLSLFCAGVVVLSVSSLAQAGNWTDGTLKIMGREGSTMHRANVVRHYAAPSAVATARPAAQPVAQTAQVDNSGGRRVMSAEPAAAPAQVQAVAAPVYRPAQRMGAPHRNRDAWDNADTKILGLEGR